MKKLKYIIIGVIIALVVSFCFKQLTSATPINGLKNVALDDFKKLEGNWKGEGFGGLFHENWEQSSGKFRGHGFLIIEGDTIFQEKVSINESGEFIMYASTGGKDYPTGFTLTEKSSSAWVFENPDHDSPQKLIYEFISDNELEIMVGGKNIIGMESADVISLSKQVEISNAEVKNTNVYNVALLVMEGTFNTELTAPMDVFHHTKFRDSIRAMNVFTIANSTQSIISFEGLKITPDYNYLSANLPNIDILVIPAAAHNLDTDQEDSALINFIAKTSATCEYVMSHCDGAFVLAKTGLLDGKHSTTFPGDLDEYEKMFPNTIVEKNAVFVHDDKYITSSGGAKSFEPSLYLCELLYGKKVADQLAKGMVIDWDLEKQNYVRFE